MHAVKEKIPTFDTMLVNVDHNKGQTMFLLYHLQEGFSTVQLVDTLKLGTKAEALVHFLHALFSVVFQATLILLLDQLVLLSTHLQLKTYLIYKHSPSLGAFFFGLSGMITDPFTFLFCLSLSSSRGLDICLSSSLFF